MSKRKITISVLCVVLLAAVMCICFAGCEDNKEEALAYVTLEVNPSIELIVDEDQIVLSINGLNDDGKVLLINEEFVGKKLDEVVARISELLEELGYVAKEKHQTMQMHVVTESEKLREAVEQTVESGVAVLKAHCDMAFEIAEAVQHETLVQAVLYTNPGMDEEEVRAMSDTELIRIYKSAMLEKAEFALCYLEDQFYQMKEMEFKFRYYEEIRGVLEGVNQIIVAAYDIPLGILRTGVEHLTELQADLYDVTFDDVIIIVNGQNVFDAATQFVIDAIQSAIDSLNNTIDQLDDYRQKYIEASDADKLLTDVQNAINDAKDGFFAEFEDEFGGAISKAKERITEYKAALAGTGE